jgi:hypothetical protein
LNRKNILTKDTKNRLTNAEVTIKPSFNPEGYSKSAVAVIGANARFWTSSPFGSQVIGSGSVAVLALLPSMDEGRALAGFASSECIMAILERQETMMKLQVIFMESVMM